MSHVLDNPIWNALNSGNKSLAYGNDLAKHFSKNVSTFVGLEHPGTKNFQALYDMIPFPGAVATISAAEIPIPLQWQAINHFRLFQMIYGGSNSINVNLDDIVPLNDQHIPEMLQLTKATNPGPFYQRTIDFGNYHGIFKETRLVAMAGQRLHVGNYQEISAVCTHPDFLGNGYASQLIRHQIKSIVAASNIPMLHVKNDNEGAVKLYKKLGFYIREELMIHVFKKNG